MSERPTDRVRSAVDSILDRGEMGPTTTNRLRRAISQALGEGPAGREAAIREYRRILEAMSSGTIDDDIGARVSAQLMAAWSNPVAPSARRRRAATKTARTAHRRDLALVPSGTTVSYDGITATITAGHMTVRGLRGTFHTPTPAAKAVTGQEAINGWQAWRLLDGRTLGEAYDTGTW